MYLNSVLEECLVYNDEVKHNGVCKILNIQTDFKYNNI